MNQLYRGIIEGIDGILGCGGSNARFLSEADKFGHGFCLHLLHDPAAVDLDGLQGSPPLARNILIHQTPGHKMKDF